MLRPETPATEAARLAALRAYDILDSEPEAAFDDLTDLAAKICGTPIALVSLVDHDRQWFKSRHGLDASETARDVAFCAHAILTPTQPLVVPDALGDLRFHDNPLVVGGPKVGSYFGVPLVDDAGLALGTLCAIDHVPRALSDDQLDALAKLARQVVSQLRLRRQVRETEAAKAEIERLFGQSLDLICVAGTDGHFRRVNPAFEHTLGFSSEELLSTPFWDLIHADDLAKTRREIDRLAGGVQSLDFENRFRCKDGGYRLLSWRASPDPHSGDLYATARDITDQRHADLAAVALTRQLIEGAPNAMVLSDVEGHIRLVNRRAEHVFGIDRHALIGGDIETILPGATDPNGAWTAAAAEATPSAATGIKLSAGLVGCRSDGSTFPVEVGLSRVLTADGIAILAAIVDMSERERTAAELAAAKREAERANASKSLFLANMSHEIRTPMNAVLGLTHLALRTELSSKQRDYLEKIDGASRMLLGIIHDILDFSKIEAGHLRLERAPFSLDEVMKGVADAIGMRAEEKGIEFLYSSDGRVPRRLMGDALRLQQVLTNLCSNAVKFTERGEVVVALSFEPDAGGRGRLAATVRDSGIGMTPAQCAELFSPFVQADASITRRFGGTGLGLSICKLLVELMGGELSARSEPGVGSEFRFSIPADVASNEDASQGARRAERGIRAGTRALVVDDNAMARQVFVEMLRSWGFVADEAATGPAALAAAALADAEDDRYALVILDWRMPAMDGLEVAKRLQRLVEPERAPRVILVSAARDAPSLRDLPDLGIQRVLPKPINPSELFDVLIDTLQRGDGALDTTALPAPSVSSNVTLDALERRWRTELAGASVLLVEDNDINQEIAVELLQCVGVHVVVAQDGAEALRKVHPGLDGVLMDIQMPVMDGVTATTHMRARADLDGLPIIAMTANAMADERERLLASGMIAFVPKPVEPALLYATLAQHLRRPRAATAASIGAAAVTGPSPAAPGPLHVEGIDWAAARRRTNGNEALLLRLLGRFVDRYGDAGASIRALVAAGDLAGAIREVHTLKGLAGSLGIVEVAEHARVLEHTLEEGGDAAGETDALAHVLQTATAALQRHLAAQTEAGLT